MKMNRKNPNTTLVFFPLRAIPVILITIAIVIIIVTIVVNVIVIYIVNNILYYIIMLCYFHWELVFCIDFFQVLGGSMDLRAPSTLHLELLWKS